MVEAAGTRPVVEIGRRRMPVAAAAALTELVVETDATGPDACTITLADNERTILDDLGIEFLTAVKVLASPATGTTDEVLFDGEVYALDTDYDRSGSATVVRAYDRSYRLRQGRVTASYNDVQDADVARGVADEVGLGTAGVAATDVIHPHLAQVNESRWDFLTRRARANGFTLAVEGEDLCFGAPPPATEGPDPGRPRSADPLQLVAGDNLLRFSVRATAAQQVTEVELRGWDFRAKEAVVATQAASTAMVETDEAPADVAKRHPGGPRHVAAHPSLTTQAECEAAVGSVAEHLAGTAGYAEGTTEGDPRLRTGAAVSINGTGRFDGRYTVTRSRHRFDGRGYRTTFVASSVHDRSLFGLTAAGSAGSPVGQASPGVVPAVVTGVQDPEELGRVTLRFPWLADGFESEWARVMQLGAGPERGVLWFPEVGDEVLVAFVEGDRRRPVVIGGLFNGQDKPPFEGYADSADGSVESRGMRTTKGHVLLFDDADGGERIEVRTGDGTLTLVLDQAGGKVVIEADGDIELTASRDIRIRADGDLALEATGSASLSGQRGVSVESAASVDVSGRPINLN